MERYPMTTQTAGFGGIWGYAICLAAIAVISVVIALMVHPDWFENFRFKYQDTAGVWCVEVNSNDCKKVEKTLLLSRLHFWAPWPGKTQIDKSKIDDNKWEEDVTEDDIATFENALEHMDGISGIRRFQVYGHGTRSVSTYKWGYWYEVGITDKFVRTNFLDAYREMCHECRHVYFEYTSANKSTYEAMEKQ
jgi:hypothetical protein